MTRDQLTKTLFLGSIFALVLYTRPGLGIDNLSYGNAYFYFYIFAFVYFLVKWLR